VFGAGNGQAYLYTPGFSVVVHDEQFFAFQALNLGRLADW